MPSLSRRSSESSVSSAGSGVTEAEFVIECDLSCLDRDTMNVGTTLKAKHLRKPIWDGLIKPFISNLNKANTLPVRLSVDNVFDLTVDGSPAMLATSIADYCNGEDVVRIALRIAPSGSGSKPTSKELKVSGLVGEEMASPVPSEASDVGSEPSTPMRFTMQRQASSGGSTPKTTSEFIVQIGDRAVSATLTKKLLKKSLNDALIEPFLKHNKKSSPFVIQVEKVLVDGEPADVTQACSLFAKDDGRPVQVLLLRPGESPPTGAEEAPDLSSEDEPKVGAISIYEGEKPALSPGFAETETPVFRTVNSAALARARSSSKRGKSRADLISDPSLLAHPALAGPL